IWDSVVQGIEGDKSVEKILLFNKKEEEYSEIPVDGIFIYVGIIPNNELVESRVELDSQGFIITDEKMHTNIPGIFAAGDIIHKVLRQVITANSDGATAAFSADKWVEENQAHFT
ncbi:MAG: FAD-dependent oxidoreductase, partial [Candidatus Cloacimonetes bacterium]|nr:FAD-dependent oxidoreductase [Candidatus Cloacimonadota bacterium]